MYEKRIKIFVAVIAAFLVVCLGRLVQMQLYSGSFYRAEIGKLKDERGRTHQLKTIRGKILDRRGTVIAADEPRFQLHIHYGLTCFFDERFHRVKLLTAAKSDDPEKAKAAVQKEISTRRQDLERIIEKCTGFGVERVEIEERIRQINDCVWNLRTYLAWKRNFPQADFQKAVPDPDKRLMMAAQVDIAEMHKSWQLLELRTDDDVFTAQLEFIETDGVELTPKPHRVYYYRTVAAQTIGWVGPEQDKDLFADDRLRRYLEGEVSGRRPGVEYVCEAILRGSRGEIFYDIDNQRIERAKTQLGKDVTLTLDIELQERIEEYLADCERNKNCHTPSAAVVIEVATGDILALVSMPVFDLNRTRYDYADIAADPNQPLLNRAIFKHYPPGSVVKPLILIAGLETGRIGINQIISCPAQKAEGSWPSCWIYNKYRTGHDDHWPNNARNAVKGSCNVYFSHLADRIEPSVLQHWLYRFGYGHNALSPPAAVERDFRQAQGQISNQRPVKTISSEADLPALEKNETRWFGIGQGNLRATPLQVANAMAAIARGGVYKQAGLFVEDANDSVRHSTPLNISPRNIKVVREGMYAVVNEHGGTAYQAFEDVDFTVCDVKVYGKTGSTEQPENAWFGGFAEDSRQRSISIAVVVEKGQSGARDAAPLARDIIRFCIEAGYLGNPEQN